VAGNALHSIASLGLEATVRDNNPWWGGERIHELPPMRRWAFAPILANLKGGLTKATVLTGPRQVGKTTLLNQLITALLDEGVAPQRIFRLQFDELPELRKLREPILELARWFSEHVLGATFNRAAQEGRQAFVFLDEVQNLASWAPQLKHLVDLNPVRVMVTGSSALRIEAGRDSLAGRITTIEMGPLLLREVAEMRGFGRIEPTMPPNGLADLKKKEFWRALRDHGARNGAARRRAFEAFSERGAYPVAHAHPGEPWEKVADHLNETVVRRALQHDLRLGVKGVRRAPELLAEVFRLACRYAGQSPRQALYLAELRHALHANLGWQRVLAYLRFLDNSLLVRLIEPLELRLKRRRGAAKLCLCDHALREAWLQEKVPLAPAALLELPHLADLAGHLAESATGYFLRSIPNLGVAHFPERAAEPEVDYVLTVGEQRIPVEVKYRRRIDFEDTLGVRAFIEKSHYHAPFGVLVTLADESATDDPRLVSLPLSTLLLMR
jgi:hypothetical protein